MNYEELAAIARGVLREMGGQFTLTRESGGVYNPTTGTEVPVITTYTGAGVLGVYNQQQYNDQIQAGDVLLTLEATTIEPKIGDKVAGRLGYIATLFDSETGVFDVKSGLFDGSPDTYKVVSVIKTAPDGATAVIYELQCRH